MNPNIWFLKFIPEVSKVVIRNRVMFGSLSLLLAVMVQVSFNQTHLHAKQQQIVDAKGRKISVVDTSRIVSIGGSVTEIIYALGEQDRIIARDSTSTYPAKALTKKNIGYMRALATEGVLSVGPTLILALDGAGPKEVIEVLEKASVPFATVPHKFSEQGIIEKIAFIGKVLGVEEKSKKLIEQVKSDFADLKKVTDAISVKKKVMFILSMRAGRVMVAGSNTAASEIIKMAGATNAIAAIEGYKPITNEAIIRSAPEAILMMQRGDHSAKAEELFKNSSFMATPAAQTKSLITLNGLYLLGFGPRTASAAKDLVNKLYGKKSISETMPKKSE